MPQNGLRCRDLNVSAREAFTLRNAPLGRGRIYPILNMWFFWPRRTAACRLCASTSARLRSWCSTRVTRRSGSMVGVCRRGIYDNMKTAVEAIFVGKTRKQGRGR
jgi:hypothetical protein